ALPATRRHARPRSALPERQSQRRARPGRRLLHAAEPAPRSFRHEGPPGLRSWRGPGLRAESLRRRLRRADVEAGPGPRGAAADESRRALAATAVPARGARARLPVGGWDPDVGDRRRAE